MGKLARLLGIERKMCDPSPELVEVHNTLSRASKTLSSRERVAYLEVRAGVFRHARG